MKKNTFDPSTWGGLIACKLDAVSIDAHMDDPDSRFTVEVKKPINDYVLLEILKECAEELGIDAKFTEDLQCLIRINGTPKLFVVSNNGLLIEGSIGDF